MTNRWLTGAIASSQVPLILFPTLVPGVATQAKLIPDAQMRAYWGFFLRVDGYAGPCCRVEDSSNPGTQQDIPFDANGFVTAAPPYGDDTRLIRVYDQMGNGDDLTAPLNANIRILFDNAKYGTWRAQFNGVEGLQSTLTTSDSPGWAIENNPFWFCSFIRNRPFNRFSEIWIIPQASNFMTMGLWQDYEHLRWRINGSGPIRWPNTHILENLDEHFMQLARVQGDMSAGSPGFGYFQSQLYETRNHTHPLSYDPGQKLWVGDGGIGTPWLGGEWFELGIYSTSLALTGTHVVFFDDIMREAFRHVETLETRQQKLYSVIGPRDSIFARQQKMHTIIAPRSLGVRQSRKYTIFGDENEGVAVQDQRMYVIIQP